MLKIEDINIGWKKDEEGNLICSGSILIMDSLAISKVTVESAPDLEHIKKLAQAKVINAISDYIYKSDEDPVSEEPEKKTAEEIPSEVVENQEDS